MKIDLETVLAVARCQLSQPEYGRFVALLLDARMLHGETSDSWDVEDLRNMLREARALAKELVISCSPHPPITKASPEVSETLRDLRAGKPMVYAHTGPFK